MMIEDVAVQNSVTSDYFEKKHLFSYIASFFAAWTFYVTIAAPYLRLHYPAVNELFQFKVLLWTIPVLVYLSWEKMDALEYLKLKGNLKNGAKWAISFALIFIVWQITSNAIGAYATHKALKFSLFFDTDKWISGVILVGFTEEILFRGFILQKAMNFMDFWPANFITSILFLFSHFPGWYMQYVTFGTIPPLVACTFAYVFVFSIIQGHVLNKSKSLWACIVIHSVANLTAYSLTIS